eukprot:TRINITY_DN758_c1_g2_i1.p1 TRINITY_DN758_c1_g2~~TRINITY_DN758_c1_g2_i1.p1  ORF type:complete len:272 (-),score=128.39 TRINITY_DN758_c1_g2_i1:193-1008(-)
MSLFPKKFEAITRLAVQRVKPLEASETQKLEYDRNLTTQQKQSLKNILIENYKLKENLRTFSNDKINLLANQALKSFINPNLSINEKLNLIYKSSTRDSFFIRNAKHLKEQEIVVNSSNQIHSLFQNDPTLQSFKQSKLNEDLSKLSKSIAGNLDSSEELRNFEIKLKELQYLGDVLRGLNDVDIVDYFKADEEDSNYLQYRLDNHLWAEEKDFLNFDNLSKEYNLIADGLNEIFPNQFERIEFEDEIEIATQNFTKEIEADAAIIEQKSQ